MLTPDAISLLSDNPIKLFIKEGLYINCESDLIGGGIFECFLYVKDISNRIHPLKYSFHWQNAEGKLVRRIDNAPHHTALPYTPHHLHRGADHVEGFSETPDIFAFISEIEMNLIKE